MENFDKFDKVEIYEKDGKGEFWINNTLLKNVNDYEIKRGIDTTQINFSISIPSKNLKTLGDN